MSIIFNKKPVRCGNRHAAPMWETPMHNVRRDNYFGEIGSSEITGGYGGRKISVECWIHDRTWGGSQGSDKLERYLEDLCDEMGENEELKFIGQYNHTFKNCTLTAVHPNPEFPPRQDDIGLLGVYNGILARGIWYTVVTLDFFQLKVKNDD